jgi:chaperonin cofactor prefoldin
MRWLLRLISPRAWQRDQFQQLQYQISQLSVQIENLQYQLIQSHQALEVHIDEKLNKEA